MTPASPPRRLPAWAPFLVLTLAFVAQAGALGGSWLLDDASVIRDDPRVLEGPAGIPRLFADGRVGGELETGAYRPLLLASYALEAPLWTSADGDPDPFGFHLTNLLLFAVCAWLLHAVLGRLLPDRPVLVLGTALAFAVHPLVTGTVSALLGRGDLLALLLCLAALRVWLAGPRPGLVTVAWTGVLWFLALLAKESALAFPLALLCVELARGSRPARATWLRAGGMLALVLVLWLLLWPGVAAGPADLPRQGLGARLLLGLEGAGRTALRLVLPVGYRGDYTDEALAVSGFPLDGPALGAALGVLALALVSLVLLLRGRRSVLAAAWLLAVGASLVAAAVAPAGASLELRFAFLAGAPLFLTAGLAAEALGRVLAGGRLARPLAAAAALAVLCCLGGLAHAEAAAWRDDAAFHDRLLRESPGHVRALVRQARLERRRAARLQARASRLPVQDRGGRPNRALVELRKRRAEALTAAEGWLGRALGRPSGRALPAAWAELGQVRLARGRPAEALIALEEAKQRDPVLQRPAGISAAAFDARRLAAAAELYFVEGTCRKALGDAERSAAALRSAVRLAPTNATYLKEAAMALMKQRRWGEGLPLLERARRHATSARERDDLDRLLAEQRQRAREMAAELYRQAEAALARGAREQALAGYEASFLADPELVDAYIKAAHLVGSYMGNYGRASKYLLEAERAVRGRGRADPAKLAEIRRQRDFLNKRKQEDDLELRREAERDARGGR